MGCPVAFAPKKNGSLCICVHYEKLNAVTVRDSYLLPRMDECIYSWAEATLFSTLDENSSYSQIELEETDREKAAPISHLGLFRFTGMTSGLKYALGTFQRTMHGILSFVKWQQALAYLDDVFISSEKSARLLDHVRSVLTLLQDARASLKLEKCEFSQVLLTIWSTLLGQDAWK